MTGVIAERARKTRGRQIRRGISWNAANLVINKGMSILVRLLLARLLVPEHFGLIAMIVVFLGLVKIFVDFGMKNALIQRARDANSLIRYDSAFWFLLGGGIGWMLLFMLAGIPLMIWFYAEPQLSDLAMVMGVSILLQSLAILPEVRLTRRMRFKSLVMAEVISTVAASAIAIALAFGGAGVWALAAQQLASIMLRTAMIWRFAHWRPRRRFSWQSLRDVLGFSGWMLGVRVSDHLRANVDRVVVGAILGASALGIYSFAFLLTEQFRSQLSQVLTNTFLPAFSRIQNNRKELVSEFYSGAEKLCLYIMPISVQLFINAELLVGGVLSSDWAEAVSPLQILSVSVMIYAISGPTPELLISIGRPSAIFSVALANTAFITVPLALILTYMYGIVGAAASIVLSMFTLRLRYFSEVKQKVEIKLSRYMCSLLPGTVLSIVLFICNELAPAAALPWVLALVHVGALASIHVLRRGDR